MAVFLRRLNAAASSGCLFRHGVKNRTEYLVAFQEALIRGIRGFSFAPVDQDGNFSESLSPGSEGVAGLSRQRFHTWPNGGGTFHESASIDPTACVEMGAIIHEKAVLGANACVGSGTVIGSSVPVGQSCWIGYNVLLSNCTVGDSCMIHSGICIGQDGFGVFVDGHAHTLNAGIGNNMEIGANTCIDRGSWRDTVIGDGTKIDNLVQIGHNVIIGKNCLLCRQVGIAGPACLGDYVVLGGRAAVKDHVTITSKVRLAANGSVIKDIKESGDYGGFPALRRVLIFPT